jgi:hypothetical protein
VAAAAAATAEPAVQQAPPPPHIDIGPPARQSAWLTWLALVLVAVLTGVLSYGVLRLFTTGKLF